MMPSKANIDAAYHAGRDCRDHGANEQNCSFAFFTHPATTLAWEQGKKGEALTVRYD